MADALIRTDTTKLKRAERELERAKTALSVFEADGDIPFETVRQERLMLQRNLEDLEQHVQDRQRELTPLALNLTNAEVII